MKLVKPVVGLFWQMGVRMIIYLDDILIFYQKQGSLRAPCLPLFEVLGLLMNRKKCLVIPTQQLEFLGFQICFNNQTPSEKLRKIHQDAHHLLHQTTLSLRELARFVAATARGNSSSSSTLHGLTEPHELGSTTILSPPSSGEVQFPCATVLRSK